MTTSRTITINDFLTEKEIKQAIKLAEAEEIAEQIIKPNMDRINAALGQENDPLYLGYMVEYVVGQISKH